MNIMKGWFWTHYFITRLIAKYDVPTMKGTRIRKLLESEVSPEHLKYLSIPIFSFGLSLDLATTLYALYFSENMYEESSRIWAKTFEEGTWWIWSIVYCSFFIVLPLLVLKIMKRRRMHTKTLNRLILITQVILIAGAAFGIVHIKWGIQNLLLLIRLGT